MLRPQKKLSTRSLGAVTGGGGDLVVSFPAPSGGTASFPSGSGLVVSFPAPSGGTVSFPTWGMQFYFPGR